MLKSKKGVTWSFWLEILAGVAITIAIILLVTGQVSGVGATLENTANANSLASLTSAIRDVWSKGGEEVLFDWKLISNSDATANAIVYLTSDVAETLYTQETTYFGSSTALADCINEDPVSEDACLCLFRIKYRENTFGQTCDGLTKVTSDDRMNIIYKQTENPYWTEEWSNIERWNYEFMNIFDGVSVENAKAVKCVKLSEICPYAADSVRIREPCILHFDYEGDDNILVWMHAEGGTVFDDPLEFELLKVSRRDTDSHIIDLTIINSPSTELYPVEGSRPCNRDDDISCFCGYDDYQKYSTDDGDQVFYGDNGVYCFGGIMDDCCEEQPLSIGTCWEEDYYLNNFWQDNVLRMKYSHVTGESCEEGSLVCTIEEARYNPDCNYGLNDYITCVVDDPMCDPETMYELEEQCGEGKWARLDENGEFYTDIFGNLDCSPCKKE